jgi:hypothetical protein
MSLKDMNGYGSECASPVMDARAYGEEFSSMASTH